MEPSRSVRDDNGAEAAGAKPAAGSIRRARTSRRALAAILLWAACAAALVVPTVIWAKRSHDATLAAAREEIARATESGARATENVIGLLDVFLRRLADAAGDGELSGVSIDGICPSLICSNNRRLSLTCS